MLMSRMCKNRSEYVYSARERTNERAINYIISIYLTRHRIYAVAAVVVAVCSYWWAFDAYWAPEWTRNWRTKTSSDWTWDVAVAETVAAICQSRCWRISLHHLLLVYASEFSIACSRCTDCWSRPGSRRLAASAWVDGLSRVVRPLRLASFACSLCSDLENYQLLISFSFFVFFMLEKKNAYFGNSSHLSSSALCILSCLGPAFELHHQCLVFSSIF